MLELYKNIKNKREALGISQDELAQLTGYTSRSSIAKIEKGLVDLPQTKIELFAKALNTTPSSLMGWNNNTNDELPPDIRSAARDMMELSNDDKKLAIQMINSLAKKGREANKL